MIGYIQRPKGRKPQEVKSLSEAIAYWWEKEIYPTNKWFSDKEMEIYVRRGHHLNQNKELVETLDLATIEVKEKLRGNGIFTRFLNELEKWFHGNIYVENVLTEQFADFFRRRTGYIDLTNDDDWLTDACFIRPEIK